MVDGLAVFAYKNISPDRSLIGSTRRGQLDFTVDEFGPGTWRLEKKKRNA